MTTSCSVQSCDAPMTEKSARGMCPRHYAYWLRTGSPDKPCAGCGEPLNQGRFAKYCSEPCKPRCSVEGCDGAVRKRSWCASHYAQQQRTGTEPEPFKWKWYDGHPRTPKQAKESAPLDREGPCKNCGEAIGRSPRQQFCTHACYQAHRLYGGPRPTSTTCVACGVEIDLMVRGKKGQLRKSVVKFCRPCKRDYAKYKMSAGELAKRDGTDCGICGLPVDMTVARVDGLDCPSVDHVVPRARGGSHDPENLVLAHLRCNMAKSDRIAAESGCK